jgi:hypothetical protein
MPAAGPVGSWWSRYALGLWFCGIAALGFVRFFMKAGGSGLPPTMIAWLWLAGSAMMALVGVVVLVRTAFARNPMR